MSEQNCNISEILVETSICVKKHDLLVSRATVEQDAWEEHNVKNLMKAMSLYDSAVFIGKILYFVRLSQG